MQMLASHPGRFTLGQTTATWVGPRAGMDACHTPNYHSLVTWPSHDPGSCSLCSLHQIRFVRCCWRHCTCQCLSLPPEISLLRKNVTGIYCAPYVPKVSGIACESDRFPSLRPQNSCITVWGTLDCSWYDFHTHPNVPYNTPYKSINIYEYSTVKSHVTCLRPVVTAALMTIPVLLAVTQFRPVHSYTCLTSIVFGNECNYQSIRWNIPRKT
jgi:hypothetical protein